MLFLSFALAVFALVPGSDAQGVDFGKILSKKPSLSQARNTATVSVNTKATAASITSTLLKAKTTSKRVSQKAKGRKADTGACSQLVIPFAYSPQDNTPKGFLLDAQLRTISQQASGYPAGYSNVFAAQYGTISASGLLQSQSLSSFNISACAATCNSVAQCKAFNIYFERSPTLLPGLGCPNPKAVADVKCDLWSTSVQTSQATNIGRWRTDFMVVNQGSNGYNKLPVPAKLEGFRSPVALAGAVDAPTAYVGADFFSTESFDPAVCANFCRTTTTLSKQTLQKPKSKVTRACNFFNALDISLNGISQGTYCQLYATDVSTQAKLYTATLGKTRYDLLRSFGYLALVDNTLSSTSVPVATTAASASTISTTITSTSSIAGTSSSSPSSATSYTTRPSLSPASSSRSSVFITSSTTAQSPSTPSSSGTVYDRGSSTTLSTKVSPISTSRTTANAQTTTTPAASSSTSLIINSATSAKPSSTTTTTTTTSTTASAISSSTSLTTTTTTSATSVSTSRMVSSTTSAEPSFATATNPPDRANAGPGVESKHFNIHGTTEEQATYLAPFLEATYQCFIRDMGWRTTGLGFGGQNPGQYFKTNIYSVTDLGGAWMSVDGSNGLGYANIDSAWGINIPVYVHEYGHVIHYHQENWVGQGRTGAWWETMAQWITDTSLSSPLCASARARYNLTDAASLATPMNLDMLVSRSYQVIVDGTQGSGNYYEAWPFFTYLTNNPDNIPALGSDTLRQMLLQYALNSNEDPLSTLQRVAGGTSVQSIVGRYWARMAFVDIGHPAGVQAFIDQQNNLDYQHLDTVSTGLWRVKESRRPRYMGSNMIKLTGASGTVSVQINSTSAFTATAAIRAANNGPVRYAALSSTRTTTFTAGQDEQVIVVVANTPSELIAYDAFNLANSQASVGMDYTIAVQGAIVATTAPSKRDLEQGGLARGARHQHDHTSSCVRP
ncbi:hypothetical protein CAC42_19 [Sphaceloma murrayae]|uniref:Uncharacterized protein n=1 Tax=Sphaceloma murrayae TaxID=2082308 RepID=A0A2K1QS12_9PEZI|nr:hypothetical protein CAC42_19 [Sphaceloma murrayae]